jgi:hypothetical protein
MRVKWCATSKRSRKLTCWVWLTTITRPRFTITSKCKCRSWSITLLSRSACISLSWGASWVLPSGCKRMIIRCLSRCSWLKRWDTSSQSSSVSSGHTVNRSFKASSKQVLWLWKMLASQVSKETAALVLRVLMKFFWRLNRAGRVKCV